MIPIVHWLASFVVLSVALAHMEEIRFSDTITWVWFGRALGWALIGISAFSGIITPLFGNSPYIPHNVGMIGFALVALAYRWEGATSKPIGSRRATD
jgi:hypothetical protein